ncbi:Peptidase family M50 [Polystyrenella longa]|uniref:Peptidase family M50 n=1 Tax=Polystyrenella longa TaxID=2528007 RepID=A0A518CP57_9PLAN|nr:site-2 protease family protein [Polystyrenella longa]QDU81009.1 Peptidase family M50 [Polystyrenella longa]
MDASSPSDHHLSTNTESEQSPRPVEVTIVERPNRPPSHYRVEQFYEMPPRYLRAAILYIATCLSTFIAGAFMSGQIMVEEGTYWPLIVRDWSVLQEWGWGYSLSIMGILTFHELGHYLQSRRYGVPASLPYFIPLPVIQPFGTLGAVIVQRTGWRDRKILFDIAVTGPLAGLVLTIPILYFGLLESRYIDFPKDVDMSQVIRFGDPLIMKLMAAQVLGEQPPNTEIMLTPLLFAGWVGLFVTALNLIPLGQLDGGHILYALLGRKAHYVAISLTMLAIALMTWFGQYEYILMLILVIFMGVKHPPTGNDRAELGKMRTVIGWLTLAFLILGFTVDPI